MLPVHFPGAREIKKPDNMTDEECMSIWAASGVDDANFPFYVTAWKPSKEDLEMLNLGEPIYVKTICNRLPPMAIFVLDAEGKPMGL